jgi:tRNASer (uridine44-2'-O)-methyltransferase
VSGEQPTIEDATEEDLDTLIAGVNLGLADAKTTYAKYRLWLARESARCGWEVECDVLRIPSTRNWGIVGELLFLSLWTVAHKAANIGRRPVISDAGSEYAYRVAEEVKARGLFKSRKPEGKTSDH